MFWVFDNVIGVVLKLSMYFCLNFMVFLVFYLFLR